jgi:hypothetical protein
VDSTQVLNEDELAVMVAASRAEQGLGPFITDATVITKVAILAASALRSRAGEVVMADAGTSTK